MSDLIVVGYDDAFRADEVRLTLERLEKQHLIDLDDAVVVVATRTGKSS